MVIDDFNVCRCCIYPLKADAKLTVNPDVVLTSPVTGRCLKPVSWRGSVGYPVMLTYGKQPELRPIPTAQSAPDRSSQTRPCGA